MALTLEAHKAAIQACLSIWAAPQTADYMAHRQPNVLLKVLEAGCPRSSSVHLESGEGLLSGPQLYAHLVEG
jgi:hypothetical protein